MHNITTADDVASAKKEFDSLVADAVKNDPASDKDIRALAREMGIKSPIRYHDSLYTGEIFGIPYNKVDNSAYIPPGYYLNTEGQTPITTKKDLNAANKYGQVAISRRMMVLPVIAHEMGHAKSFAQGTQNTIEATPAERTAMTAGVIGTVGVPVASFILGNKYGKNWMKWAGLGAGALLAYMTGRLGSSIFRRRQAEEVRASRYALQALGKLYPKKLNTYKSILDKALLTYGVQESINRLSSPSDKDALMGLTE